MATPNTWTEQPLPGNTVGQEPRQQCPVPQPPLPLLNGDKEWPDRTVEWWEAWKDSPQAESFTVTDWEWMLDTALVHADVWGAGNVARAQDLHERLTSVGGVPRPAPAATSPVLPPRWQFTSETPDPGMWGDPGWDTASDPTGNP